MNDRDEYFKYKAYRGNGVIYGIFSHREMAEQALRDGRIAHYEEAPEQVQYNGKFYDKDKL